MALAQVNMDYCCPTEMYMLNRHVKNRDGLLKWETSEPSRIGMGYAKIQLKLQIP